MKYVFCDERITQRCAQELKRCGFLPVLLKKSENLSEAVSSHIDMLTFCDKDTFIFSKSYLSDNPKLSERIRAVLNFANIIEADETFSKVYPKDVLFNAFVMKNFVFCKEDAVSSAVKNYAAAKGYRVVNVNQGYPACVTLRIGDDFAITADSGMQKALLSCGIRVLKIENSDKISLPPYEFGFIGGACGVFSKTVYFIGNLDSHPSAKLIKQAIVNEGFTYHSLDPDVSILFDLGGLVFYDDGIDNN